MEMYYQDWDRLGQFGVDPAVIGDYELAAQEALPAGSTLQETIYEQGEQGDSEYPIGYMDSGTMFWRE
jgi:hypothetical protein